MTLASLAIAALLAASACATPCTDAIAQFLCTRLTPPLGGCSYGRLMTRRNTRVRPRAGSGTALHPRVPIGHAAPHELRLHRHRSAPGGWTVPGQRRHDANHVRRLLGHDVRAMYVSRQNRVARARRKFTATTTSGVKTTIFWAQCVPNICSAADKTNYVLSMQHVVQDACSNAQCGYCNCGNIDTPLLPMTAVGAPAVPSLTCSTALNNPGCTRRRSGARGSTCNRLTRSLRLRLLGADLYTEVDRSVDNANTCVYNCMLNIATDTSCACNTAKFVTDMTRDCSYAKGTVLTT
jgi:hypothetical protein